MTYDEHIRGKTNRELQRSWGQFHASRDLGELEPHGLWRDATCRSQVWGPPRDVDAAIAVLREAVAAGVNHIDTSDFYGPHVTNQIIKQALHPYPDDLVIVTKVGARRGADKSWIPCSFAPGTDRCRSRQSPKSRRSTRSTWSIFASAGDWSHRRDPSKNR